jgi:hypothetical protein
MQIVKWHRPNQRPFSMIYRALSSSSVRPNHKYILGLCNFQHLTQLLANFLHGQTIPKEFA